MEPPSPTGTAGPTGITLDGPSEATRSHPFDQRPATGLRADVPDVLDVSRLTPPPEGEQSRCVLLVFRNGYARRPRRTSGRTEWKSAGPDVRDVLNDFGSVKPDEGPTLVTRHGKSLRFLDPPYSLSSPLLAPCRYSLSDPPSLRDGPGSVDVVCRVVGSFRVTWFLSPLLPLRPQGTPVPSFRTVAVPQPRVDPEQVLVFYPRQWKDD